MTRIFTLVALALLTGCAAMKQQMVEEAMVDIWENGNLARIDGAYEPELGAEVKRFVQENRELYPDLDIRIDDAVIKGNRYVTVWTVTGTHKDLGKKVTLQGVSVRTRVDGMIVDEHMFYDVKAIYDQLGFTVVPPEGVSPFVSREEAMAPDVYQKPVMPAPEEGSDVEQKPTAPATP